MKASLVTWLPWSVLNISGLPFLKRFFQRLNTKISLKGIRKPPGEHVTAVPVYYNHQVQESSCHGYISDVRRPCLIWPCYLQVVE